ncbi:MAG: SCO family protein [Hyphomicrobium sp.]
MAGKIWIADFIFTTCPGPCPRMSATMKRVEKGTTALPNVEIVSFTVDPDHDTPPVLAEYAQRYAADTRRWHFLTGPMKQLDALSFDAFHLNHTDGKLGHSTRFAIVDGKGQLRAFIGTEDADPGASNARRREAPERGILAWTSIPYPH